MLRNGIQIGMVVLFLMVGGLGWAQGNQSYWQQHVDYSMEVFMDVNTYKYSGNQTLVYTNNSPDDIEPCLLPYVFQCFSARERNGYSFAKY